jgi:UDP:flavonoid glycosyltransferase YjiC (YdhE family)
VPVLNELGRLIPGLTVLLRTTVPPQFFDGRLEIPWELSQAQQDIGCIHQGPLHIDIPATWTAHERFHSNWSARVEEEALAITAKRPDLVLSDISYLAVEAGARAGIPTIGLCNLSWDLVLERLMDDCSPNHAAILQLIRQAYLKAELMIRLSPGLPMNAFRKVLNVGPVLGSLPTDSQQAREFLAGEGKEITVLVGFGGVPMEELPFTSLEAMTGYRFILSGRVPVGFKRLRSLPHLPPFFGSLLASIDLLVTKPGYNMFVEAIAHQKPVVYVRRPNFADEACLVEYLHRYGRGVELSAADFAAGKWLDAIEIALALPQPTTPPPPPTGAVEAASILADYL